MTNYNKSKETTETGENENFVTLRDKNFNEVDEHAPTFGNQLNDQQYKIQSEFVPSPKPKNINTQAKLSKNGKLSLINGRPTFRPTPIEKSR